VGFGVSLKGRNKAIAPYKDACAVDRAERSQTIENPTQSSRVAANRRAAATRRGKFSTSHLAACDCLSRRPPEACFHRGDQRGRRAMALDEGVELESVKKPLSEAGDIL